MENPTVALTQFKPYRISGAVNGILPGASTGIAPSVFFLKSLSDLLGVTLSNAKRDPFNSLI
jgi:hypothetical protein